ncbi:hypothetical protein WJX72_007738 [[Myrmecia] bisecta]|uniref:ALA-interacting subunit n=1 Tax=[Myrmecia] bisecta TaxID=41462 RepID=A0AAW1PEM9_9CHLO
MAADGEETKPTKEPKYSKFTQQELPACKPLLTPKWVIAIFLVVGLVFIPIGAVCLAASVSVIEVSQRYDDVCAQGATSADKEASLMQLAGAGSFCNVTLSVPKQMKAPVFVYYELDNFYQNHRRYVKSRSDQQLRGEEAASSSLKDCEPELYVGGDRDKMINPCGLIAWSYFNDTFALAVTETGSSSVALPVNETGIAWATDISKKFGPYNTSNFNSDPAFRGGGAILGPVQDDEHFIVWMRTAALPNFRKLWGRITQTIPAGSTITVTVNNRYNTYRFDGKKKIVLSTTSWLGGKNTFLGIAYLTVGSVSLAFSVLFFVLQWRHPRKLGDVSYLSWNAKANAAS